MTGFYRCLRGILRVLFAIIFPLRVEGLENLPASGPVILCANHVSIIDPAALIVVCPRAIRFMAKSELFESKALGWLLRKMGAFSVRRGESDLASVRAALQVLQEGNVFGIFPQGHRQNSEEDRDTKTGAAMIALRSGAATLPVRVSGKYRLFRRTVITFHPPVQLEDLRRPINASAMQQASQRISQGIWAE